MFKRLLPCAGLLALAALAPSVHAQVANGPWSSWSPTYNTQLVGSGAVSGSTYSISSTSTSTEQRAERRYQTFSTGSKQFQGSVKVNSLGGDRICLKQTFQDGVGPWNMIAVKKPGSLYEVEGGATLASYTIGNTVRINTVTYTGSDHVAVYVNGSMVEDITGGAGSYYDKLGTYRTASGQGPVSATWSSIQFWQK
jgi:hypothetical protein